jgi:hypothetical protein
MNATDVAVASTGQIDGESRTLDHVAYILHDPESGRLDAKRISDLFGIPLRQLAALMEKKPQTVAKTPDSQALQRELRVFERIAAALASLIGSPEGLRIWMNAGNPQLNGMSPTELVLGGRGQVVTDLLESTLVGQPG